MSFLHPSKRAKLCWFHEPHTKMSMWPRAVRQVPCSLENSKEGERWEWFPAISPLHHKTRMGTAFGFVGSPCWLAHSAMGAGYRLHGLAACHVLQSHDKQQAHASRQPYVIKESTSCTALYQHLGKPARSPLTVLLLQRAGWSSGDRKDRKKILCALETSASGIFSVSMGKDSAESGSDEGSKLLVPKFSQSKLSPWSCLLDRIFVDMAFLCSYAS